jgi:hypothetical protein
LPPPASLAECHFAALLSATHVRQQQSVRRDEAH